MTALYLKVKRHVTAHYQCLLNGKEMQVCVFMEIWTPLGSVLLFLACRIPGHLDTNLCLSLALLVHVIWERSEVLLWPL